MQGKRILLIVGGGVPPANLANSCASSGAKAAR